MLIITDLNLEITRRKIVKAKSQKKLFVEMTPAQAATVNGGAYWNRGVVKGGGGGGGSSSTDSTSA